MKREEITIPIKPAIRPDHHDDLGDAVTETAGIIQKRLLKAADDLRIVTDELRYVEVRTRWLKGDLSATLKNRLTELEAIAKALETEAEDAEKKMLGKGQEPITERVDAAHLERVAAARAMP